jgi:hypothetical protein
MGVRMTYFQKCLEMFEHNKDEGSEKLVKIVTSRSLQCAGHVVTTFGQELQT